MLPGVCWTPHLVYSVCVCGVSAAIDVTHWYKWMRYCRARSIQSRAELVGFIVAEDGWSSGWMCVMQVVYRLQGLCFVSFALPLHGVESCDDRLWHFSSCARRSGLLTSDCCCCLMGHGWGLLQLDTRRVSCCALTTSTLAVDETRYSLV